MTQPVRIPADVDREDTVLANLTARQVLILAVTGIVLYGMWSAARSFLPLPVFAALALPIAAASAMLALGRSDGLPLDRMVLAAVRQRMAPRYQVTAPEGIQPAPAWLTSRVTREEQGNQAAENVSPAALRLPAEGVTEAGVVDLGTDGVAVVAVCSTVNFALRTPSEQEALVATFGRYLHSLTAPVQVLVRTERLDLSGQIAELRERAPALPHPALEAAAREHADYLGQLAEQTDLLRRQVLLVLREPLHAYGPVDGLGGTSPLAAFAAKRRATRHMQAAAEATRRAAEARLVRRLAEAAELLHPAGLVVTALDAGQATAVLAAACNPESLIPPSADGLAGADEVITTTPAPEEDGDRPHPASRNPAHQDLSPEESWDRDDEAQERFNEDT